MLRAHTQVQWRSADVASNTFEIPELLIEHAPAVADEEISDDGFIWFNFIHPNLAKL